MSLTWDLLSISEAGFVTTKKGHIHPHTILSLHFLRPQGRWPHPSLFPDVTVGEIPFIDLELLLRGALDRS